MENEYEKIILKKLKELSNQVSIRQLSKKVGVSYPTVLKYVHILRLKNKINLSDFGNTKMVKWKP